MKLTREQVNAVKCSSNVALESCPGSGKTRTIVAKLLECLDDVRQTTRMISCITYLNSAVNEINHRLSSCITHEELEDYYEIGTIHSFCLRNIFRLNYWRIDKFSGGFAIITPDDDEYKEFVSNIIENNSLDPKSFDDFSFLVREGKISGRMSDKAAKEYWEYLDDNNLVDFNDIIYYSACLIRENEYIIAGLSAKYAWILVDEFQDTSIHQKEILKAISDYKRTKFFIVGDPCQSIMGFAGGSSLLMKQFSKEIVAKNDFSLTGNFRSSSRIINCAEELLPRDPKMDAVGENKYYNHSPLWIRACDSFSGIDEYFLPAIKEHNISLGECAILAPNFYIFLKLAPKMREAGISILGPGSRPYRRSNHIIAPLIEEVCLFIETQDIKQIKIIRYKILDVITICEDKVDKDFFTLKGDIAILKILNAAKNLKNKNVNAKQFIVSFSEEIASLLHERGFIKKEAISHIATSGKGLVSDIEEHCSGDPYSGDNLTIEDLSLFSINSESIKLLTLHRAKGREFDAVAVICVHDGLIPYGAPYAGSDEENESRRLFYVGMTRARKLLMFFTEVRNLRSPSRFLTELFPAGPHIIADV